MKTMKWILTVCTIFVAVSCKDVKKMSCMSLFDSGPKYSERIAMGPDGYEFYRKESGETGIIKNDSLVFEDYMGNEISYLYHPYGHVGLYIVHKQKQGDEPYMHLYDLEGDLKSILPGTDLSPYSPDAEGLDDKIYYERNLAYDKGYSLYDYKQDVYTKESYDEFEFEMDKSGNLRYVIGKTNGDFDILTPKLQKALPSRYETMVIQELPSDGSEVRYMTNEFGFMGVRTLDMEIIVPEVFNYVEPVQWPGDENSEIYWLVNDESDHYGLYTYNVRPIVGIEHGIDWIELEYLSSENYQWIMAHENYYSKTKYFAINKYGRQQTKEYQTKLFYKSGNFYHLTHAGADEGYLCETPEWSEEFFSIQSGLSLSVYIYDDGIRPFGENGRKFKYKGYENGYYVFDGESSSNNLGSSWITYYVNKSSLVMRQTMSMNTWGGMPVFKDLDTYYTPNPMTLREYRMKDFSEYDGDSYIETTEVKVQTMAKAKETERNKERQDRWLAHYGTIEKENIKSSVESQKQERSTPSEYIIPHTPITPLIDYPVPTTTVSSDDKLLKQKNYEIEYRSAEKICSSWYNAALSVPNGGSYIDNDNNLVGVRGSSSGMSTTGMRANSHAKMQFKRAKQDLINIRQRAQYDGINLTPSSWETTMLH